jgi:hypothetical protein
MAGFKAEGVVEALDYDFRPFVNAHGTIPEPTDKQIAGFLQGFKDMAKEAEKELPTDIDTTDPAAMLAALDSLDSSVVEKMMGRMSEIFAALCNGTPSAEQIADLPMRVRSIFFNWLQTEVMSPEAVPGGGNVREMTPRSARAG